MDDIDTRRFPQRPRPPWLTPLMALAGVAFIAYGIFRLSTDSKSTPKAPVPSPASVPTTPRAAATKGLSGTPQHLVSATSILLPV